MSNRIQDMGMDVQINRRLNSKYDPESEREAIQWLNELANKSVDVGFQNVHAALKNGQYLVDLINVVYKETPELPAAAKKIRLPVQYNTMSAPFKQMENIQKFLKAAEAYGVPRASLFQTVDLYETRNMAQVLNTLLQLGTECQRNNFKGKCCGPRPTSENKRDFSEEQLRMSQGIIGLQAGTNKCASQKGMSMGAVRHIADIKTEDMCADGQGIIGLQAGSNKGASQKGMSMGSVRHIADIKVDNMSDEAKGVIGLQAGSNKGASQKGMSMGAVRHIADIKVDNMSDEAKGVIGLQAGSNQGASQKGMSMGSVRHISDIKTGEMSADGKSTIGLQAGSNQGASQAGMRIGTQRFINDVRTDNQ